MRTRAERRYNTERRIKNLARRLKIERPYLSRSEAYRLAQTRAVYHKWTWDKEEAEEE